MNEIQQSSCCFHSPPHVSANSLIPRLRLCNLTMVTAMGQILSKMIEDHKRRGLEFKIDRQIVSGFPGALSFNA